MTTTNFPNGLTLTSSALTAHQIQNLFQIAIIEALGMSPGTVTQATLTQDSNQMTLTSVGAAAVGQLIIGQGIPPGTTMTDISGNVCTMSANASFPSTYGAAGYGDFGYGDPETWTAQVSIGGDATAFSTVRVGWQPNGQPAWDQKQDVITITGVVIDDPYNRIRDVTAALNDAISINETTSYTRAWEMKFSIYGPHSTDNARLIKSVLRLNWMRQMLSGSNLYLVPNESDPVRFPENWNKQWWDRSDYRARYYEGVTETITQQTVASAEVVLEAAIGGYGSDGYGDDPYGDPTTVDIDFTVSASS